MGSALIDSTRTLRVETSEAVTIDCDNLATEGGPTSPVRGSVLAQCESGDVDCKDLREWQNIPRASESRSRLSSGRKSLPKTSSELAGRATQARTGSAEASVVGHEDLVTAEVPLLPDNGRTVVVAARGSVDCEEGHEPQGLVQRQESPRRLCQRHEFGTSATGKSGRAVETAEADTVDFAGLFVAGCQALPGSGDIASNNGCEEEVCKACSRPQVLRRGLLRRVPRTGREAAEASTADCGGIVSARDSALTGCAGMCPTPVVRERRCQERQQPQATRRLKGPPHRRCLQRDRSAAVATRAAAKARRSRRNSTEAGARGGLAVAEEGDFEFSFMPPAPALSQAAPYRRLSQRDRSVAASVGTAVKARRTGRKAKVTVLADLDGGEAGSADERHDLQALPGCQGPSGHDRLHGVRSTSSAACVTDEHRARDGHVNCGGLAVLENLGQPGGGSMDTKGDGGKGDGEVRRGRQAHPRSQKPPHRCLAERKRLPTTPDGVASKVRRTRRLPTVMAAVGLGDLVVAGRPKPAGNGSMDRRRTANEEFHEQRPIPRTYGPPLRRLRSKVPPNVASNRRYEAMRIRVASRDPVNDALASGGTLPPASSGSSAGEDEKLHGSDFDSSDLDEVLMSIGQTQTCESAKIAKKWSERQALKRKHAREMASRNGDSGGDDNTVHSASRARLALGSQVDKELRSELACGQSHYSAGRFEEAIQCMHTVVKKQPGLADPYHVLTLIYEERGDAKKMLDAMLLAAYFTVGTDSHPIWRRVAMVSQEHGLIDQACYAYKRSMGNKANRNTNDLQSMWVLSQLYFQKGKNMPGIRMLQDLYNMTGEDSVACEAARKLVSMHRWSESRDLLERCIANGRQKRPPRVDLNALNMLGEVLTETRDFARCANLLIDVFALRNATHTFAATKLHEQPPDLVAKLAVALCLLRRPDSKEPDLICACAIEAILSHPPETHNDLQLVVIDALLTDSTAATEVAGQSRSGQTGKPNAFLASAAPSLACRRERGGWAAAQALSMLQSLEGSAAEAALGERRAMCLWRLGRVAEAAPALEEALLSPGERTEAELRELRVRTAEAWIESGRPERADQLLSSLSYEDLQRSDALPPALSAKQRRQQYQELSQFLERASDPAATTHLEWGDELQDFAVRFRHLVYDCELDYARLANHSAGAAVGRTVATTTPFGSESAIPDAVSTRTMQLKAAAAAAVEEVCESAAAPSCAETAVDGAKSPSGSATVGFGSGESVALVAPVTSESLMHAEQRPVRPDTIVAFETRSRRVRNWELHPFDSSAQVFRTKRRHLGLESIEDIFGFEAYLSFVVRGIGLLHDCGVLENRPGVGSGRITEIMRAVELCEMILQNRRLVSMRNPVKRRMMRTLALKSVSLAFKARLWRIVFRHLRVMCDKEGDDGPLALFTRVLFTHADVELMSQRNSAAADRDESVAWEAHHVKTTAGHRSTYAASFTDVRSWALRKLLRRPKSFGFTLLAGHFCVVASKYAMAVAEYCRAHRLAPFDALPCLCLGASYLSFAMSRTAVHRHDLVLKGFAFVQRYRRLRLQRTSDSEHLPQQHLAVSALPPTAMGPLDEAVRRAESAYNFGRACHQLGISHLAARMYNSALAVFSDLEDRGLWVSGVPPPLGRSDVVVIQRSCAYNLAMLLRAQGSLDMARRTLRENVIF